MKDIKISEDIIYIGADDKTIDLFESQRPKYSFQRKGIFLKIIKML